MKTLSNDKISIEIANHGAELTSIMANEQEYLWQGDPKYWGRHSPVLFPIVGRVWDNQYKNEGAIYKLGQHGFARDMDFQLTYEEDNAVVYTLESNEETMKVYPFPFVLEIGYRLKDNRIEVMWSVQNFGKNTKTLKYISPAEKGCVSDKEHTLELHDGLMELTNDTFGCDTYIFENGQVKKITLMDKQKAPYLSLEFSSPLVAVWSPSAAHPDVPFVCIEPWYGRCDKVGYHGEFKDREWMQHVEPGKSFEVGYSIILEDMK